MMVRPHQTRLPPGGGDGDHAPHPSEPEHTILRLDGEPRLRIADAGLDLVSNARGERHGPEPGHAEPRAPFAEHFAPLQPVGALATHGVRRLVRHRFLRARPVRAIPAGRRVQGLEDGAVVRARVREARGQRGGVRVQLLLHERHDPRAEAPHPAEELVAGVRRGDALVGHAREREGEVDSQCLPGLAPQL